jgi:hypothetical protein
MLPHSSRPAGLASPQGEGARLNSSASAGPDRDVGGFQCRLDDAGQVLADRVQVDGVLQPGRDQSALPVALAEKAQAQHQAPTQEIQPTLFPGRLDARMKPTVGTTMNVASSTTEPKSQPLAGTICRSAYDSAIAPASSTTDAAATQPVAQRRIRTVIRTPSASCAAG